MEMDLSLVLGAGLALMAPREDSEDNQRQFLLLRKMTQVLGNTYLGG